MEKRQKRGKLTDVSIFLFIIIFIAGAVFSCANFNADKHLDSANISAQNTAFTVTQNAGDGLGQFSNGDKYIFTDRTLIDDFRAGVSKFDNTAQTVTIASGNRGTIDNPYVISSANDWKKLSEKLENGTIADYGNGKYFVLADDIDFAGQTFYPLRYFKGNFYGMGHKFSNISCSTWQYWNGSAVNIPTTGANCPQGFGVFCQTVNATITDFIVENFDYRQMPSVDNLTTQHRRNAKVGGIVGYSKGNDTFLNCHSSGSINSSIAYGGHPAAGGIIGAHTHVAQPVLLYRCSSQVEAEFTTVSSLVPFTGGLIGDITEGNSVRIYDCAANNQTTIPSASYINCSAAFAFSYLGEAIIENFVGTVKVISQVQQGAGALMNTNNLTIPKLQNCYVEGKQGTTNMLPMYPVVGQSAPSYTVVDNINAVKENSLNYWSTYQASSTVRLTNYTELSSSTAMETAAKTFFGATPYSNIWDTSKIGGNYEPDNSPVRSYLKGRVDDPTDVTVEYTGSALDLDVAATAGAADWWTQDFQDKVTVTYWKGASQETPLEPYDSYTVKLALKDTEGDSWADGTTAEKTIKFKVIKRYLEFPKWNDQGGSKVFNGNTKVRFGLYWDNDYHLELHTLTGKDYFDLVSISAPTGVETLDDGWTYRAQDVKKYDIVFSIKDPDHYQFKNAPTGNKLTMEITKKAVYADLTDGTTGALKGKEGGTVTAYINVAPNQIFEDYPLEFKFSARRSGSRDATISQKITLDDTSGTENVTLDLENVSANTTAYTIVATCSTAEYDLYFNNTPTLLVEESSKNVLRWQLYESGKVKSGYYIDCDIDTTPNSSNELEVDFATKNKTITYSGKPFEFKASAYPKGYTVKTTSYNNGYKMEQQNTAVTNTKKGTNADDYYTLIDVWKDNDLTTVITFKIKWSIEPALFDLTNVKWLDDGKLMYNGGTVVSAELDPKTLPKGLEVDQYFYNQGANVGNTGTASVEFKLDPAYDGNYILPVAPLDPSDPMYDPNAPATYIYTGAGDFEWSKNWSVEPRKISTSSWSSVAHPDSSKDFKIMELKDPAAATVVDYEYYETDSHGVIIDPTQKLTANDLELPANGAKWYIAKPVLTDTTNYVLENPNAQSKPFMVGAITAALITVQVDLTKTTFDYNTQARQVSVKTTGANLNNGYFDIVYFKSDKITSMGGAPVECGTYWAAVSLKAAYTSKYVLDGDAEQYFQFEIVPAEIPVVWKTTARPPVLNLAYGQINAIQYTVYDAQGVEVTDIKNLQADTQYTIKASIKPQYRNNLKFATQDQYGSDYDTDEVPFSVTAADIAGGLHDPNDPNNPEYPQVDPDAPATTVDPADDPSGNTPSGDDPKGGVDMTKVKEFFESYWKVIVTGVCLLLFLIFTLKGLQYASQRRKIKKTIKKKYGDALGALALPFGTNWLLPDNTWNLVMLIVAGVAVLSLAFMLLEKGLLNKAKDDLEEAKLNYVPAAGVAPAYAGQRVEDFVRPTEDFSRYSEEMRRQNEEMRRRDEEMKMFFMSMMNGGMNNGGASPQYSNMGSMGGGTNITIDAENIKGIITETVAALLPGMQAMLPQQAGGNDEVVKMLADNMAEERRRSDERIAEEQRRAEEERRKSEERMAEERRRSDEERRKSEERMAQMMKSQEQLMQKILEKDNAPVVAPVVDNSNNEAMAQMLKNQEELIKQLLDKEPATVTVDKSNDEAYERMLKSQEELIHKLLDKEPAPVEDEEEPQGKKGKKKSKKAQAEEVADDNSEQMEQLARNQELLMQQLQELANKEPQVVEVEKIIDNTDNETLDQLVRQINELAAHANKEPKVVERIIEKPVEKVVEKVVEKKVPAKTPAKTAKSSATAPKEKTPRLTLDEAYAKLTKEQRKFFDKLREYALSKDKCKEKKLTYHILLGQSSINPLVKLTIKNDTTVALFKMEDEYFKSIRHSAGSDGTKLKIKESELIVSDEQAFMTAKDMIDLRVDQIERYQEYVKEQKQYGKSKK